jgi:hypothetical protein
MEHPALTRKGTEAMRRTFLTLTALGLIGAALGCHTHGVCDCNTYPIGNGTMAGYHDNVYGPANHANGSAAANNTPAAPLVPGTVPGH